jgi:serine/threonine-protein kinase
VLPEALASDPAFRQRFDREARTISQLDHPHICPLYDVGEQPPAAGTGPPIAYLVMQYLEGETLADRLLRGALPLDQALAIAMQVADALDKAHRAGVVHRDLKPGNIMLAGATRKGASTAPPVAKLLDFGLAKTAAAAAGGAGLSMLPTTPAGLTMQGAILGTFQYMAPEQLEGQEADARTDIFAFGAVLYEMLTGGKAFEGRSHASLIAAILEHQPPALSSVTAGMPGHLDHVLRRCLAKSPDERWQTASDLHSELKWGAESMTPAPQSGVVLPSQAEPGPGTRPPASPQRRSISLATAATLALLSAAAAGTAVWIAFRAAPASRPGPARLTIALPEGHSPASLENPSVAISPSGSHVAYVAVSDGRAQLFVRELGSPEARALPGTEAASNPFFSPDGQWIAFFAQQKLKKVSIASGTVQILCDAGFPRGGSWAADGTIYFAAGNASGISRVSEQGGTPAEVTTLDRAGGEVSHRWPHVLPGGRALLLNVWTGPGWDERHVYVLDLATKARTLVVRGGETGRYVPTGDVVYARSDQLFAVPFDLDALRPSGEPVLLADSVRVGGEGAQYDVSETGTLVYVRGNPRRNERRLVWVGRDGNAEPLAAPPREYVNVRISPDGRRAAVEVRSASIGLWVYDFSRDTLSPLTTGTGSSQSPVWTWDGGRLVYRGTRAGFRNLWRKAVDEASGEERLTTSTNIQTPTSWSGDGTLVYHENDPITGADVWALPTAGDRKPRAVVKTLFNEQHERLSPDGRWLAYTSNESERVEVWVQPFPGPGPRVQVSKDGGVEPLWSRDGRELFYLAGDTLMAVDVVTTPVLKVGGPRRLFDGRYVFSTTGSTGYDVSLDGRRFLRVQPLHPDPPPTQIQVVIDWFDEFRGAD